MQKEVLMLCIKTWGLSWRRRWDSNPRTLADQLISSQVVKTELGGIWRKITADVRIPKMPCLQGFPHPFASKTQWKSESESLLRFRRVLTDFRKSLLEFLIEPSVFSPQNHAFGSAWKAPVMSNRTKNRVGKRRGGIKTAVIGKNIIENRFCLIDFLPIMWYTNLRINKTHWKDGVYKWVER